MSGRWEEHDMARARGKDRMSRWRPDHGGGASCASPRAVGGSEAFMPQHGEEAYREEGLTPQPTTYMEAGIQKLRQGTQLKRMIIPECTFEGSTSGKISKVTYLF